MFVKQILRDVLRIGQHPQIDKLRLKQKVGKSCDSYFFSTRKESFLVCTLRYYSEYVEKYITTVHCYTEFDFVTFDDTKKLELDMEKLTFSKQKIPVDTTNRTGHVRVQQHTTIPGSFFEFFVALAGKVPNNVPDEDENFFFTDPVDKKPAKKKITPSPTKKKKPDIFSNLQEHAIPLLTNTSENDEEDYEDKSEFKLTEFIEKSLSAIMDSSGSKSPTLIKYISFIIDTVNETIGDDNQITMTIDDSKLEQVFEETGDDKENDITEKGIVEAV